MLWLMTTCTVGMSRPLAAEASHIHCPSEAEPPTPRVTHDQTRLPVPPWGLGHRRERIPRAWWGMALGAAHREATSVAIRIRYMLDLNFARAAKRSFCTALGRDLSGLGRACM